MAEMVDTSSYWSIVPGLMLLALGLAVTMTPATTAITGSLSRGQQGVASALDDTSREIGTADTLDPTQRKLVKGSIAGAAIAAGAAALVVILSLGKNGRHEIAVGGAHGDEPADDTDSANAAREPSRVPGWPPRPALYRRK